MCVCVCVCVYIHIYILVDVSEYISIGKLKVLSINKTSKLVLLIDVTMWLTCMDEG